MFFKTKKEKEAEEKSFESALKEGGKFLTKIKGEHNGFSIELMLKAHLASLGFNCRTILNVVDMLLY